ncbi:MAG: DUF2141 domain-containing protein [Bacteroidales bacterium]
MHNSKFYFLSLFFSVIVLSFMLSSRAVSCSAFTMKYRGDILAAKSYDWHVGAGIILSNPRGERLSVPTGIDAPMTWEARFGSITFNQYGQFLPNGGINEAGLAIEVLWLDETYYSYHNDKIPINELQWVQYHLDVCQTVDEVVESLKNFNIVPIFGKLHYFIADKEGNTAIVEFIGGEVVVHHGVDLRYKTITNNSYSCSVNYFYEGKNIGGYNASLNRFSRIVEALEQPKSVQKKSSNADDEASAFDVLNKVWIKEWTKWNIVYNLSRMQIEYKTDVSQSVKKLDVNSFNFSENAVPLYVNINNFFSGDIYDEFIPFNAEVNKQLMINTIALTGVPLKQQEIEMMALYPETKDEVLQFMNKRAEQTGTIIVNIEKLKTNDGVVNIGLFDSAESFDKLQAFNGGRAGVKNGAVTYVFYNVPLKRYYALGFYHDENLNGKMDTNIFGIPKESYGFSVRGRKFDSAKFMFDEPNMIITVKPR